MSSNLHNTVSNKNRIMRRIWFVFMVKKVTSRASLRVLSALTLAGYITTVVSLDAVVNNMRGLSDLGALLRYVVHAVVGTEVAVQASLALILALIFMIARDARPRMALRPALP